MSTSGAKSLVCKTCGKKFRAPRTGRPPKHCFAHRNPKNRTRDLAKLEADAGKSKLADELLRDAQSTATDQEARIAAAELALAPQLLACALALTDDPEAAAAIVGLAHLKGPALAAAVEAAKTRHADLLRGDISATVRVLSTLLPILGLRSIVNATKMTPGTAGAAARSFAQVVEALSGGPKPVYSGPITLVIDTSGKKKAGAG